MHAYTIDTNAGPILHRDFNNIEAAKAYCIACCPIAHRRGYSVEWYRVGVWHVCRIINTKGRVMHRLAFRQDHPTLRAPSR